MTRPDAMRIALWIAAAALLAHLGLSSGTVWSYGPLNYDDPQLLVILDQTSVADLITTPTWYAYKPIYFLSLKIDTLFGDSAVQFGHGVNWLLHGLAAFLLVLLLYDIFGSRWIAGAAGLLFAVHPVHVENVAWFAERKDVLSLVLVLLAHRSYRHGRELGRSLAVVPAVLLLLGGLTKGTVWSYAGILLVDEWLAMRRMHAAGGAATWGQAWGRLSLVLLVAVGGVVLDISVAASSGASGVEHGVGASQLMAAMAGAHAMYVQHVLMPVGLALDYAIDPAGSWASALSLVGLALALGALGALVVGIRRVQPLLAMAGAFWVFGLAPVNNIWPRTAALMADRYLYIPAIGIYIGIAALLARAKTARPWILGAAAIALAVLCEVRTASFATSERIWTDTIEKVPQSALAYIQRGTDRSTRGLHKAAREDANAALALDPRPEFRVRALLLRCQCLVGIGASVTGSAQRELVDDLLGEANAAAQAADALVRDEMVRDDPSHVRSMAQNYIGNALEMQGDVAGARDAYNRAVGLDDRNANAWLNFGTMLLKSRDPEQHIRAVAALRRARDLAPRRLDIMLQLALAHGTRGDAKRALAMLDRAEDAHGVSPELLYTRATLLLKVAQDWKAARLILRQLRDVAPDHPKGTRLEADIEVAIGRARLRKGRDERDVAILKQAIDHFDEALKVLPTHWQSQVFAGDAFAEQGRYGEARRRYKDARRIALRETWLAGLVARTAALEAAVIGRGYRHGDEGAAPRIERAAAIMASALHADVRRIDLGFAPLDDELVVLRELVALHASDREPERSHAASLLLVAAELVTGDELAALDRLRAVFGRLGASEREPALLDAALVLRATLYERQTDFDLARRDYELLARRRPDDLLPQLRQLQIELRVAQARSQVAAGHTEDAKRLAAARAEVAAAAGRVRAFADANPGSEAAGLLAVQAEINLQRWIDALKRLNALVQRFPKNPSIHRGFNAVYVAQYTKTRERALIELADKSLRQARTLSPRDLRTAMDASQLARIAGDLPSALRSAQQARELESRPHGPASRMLADLQVELGRQALQGGQLEEVEKAIAAARKVDPTRAGSWLLAGEAALKSPRRDRIARAHELARKAKALEPYNHDVNVLLAKCHKGSATSAMFHMGRFPIPRPGTPAYTKLQAMPEAERAERIAALEKGREQYRQQALHDLDMAILLDPTAEDIRETRKRRESLARASAVDAQAREQQAQALEAKARRFIQDKQLVDGLYAFWDAAQLSPELARRHLQVAQAAITLLSTLTMDNEAVRQAAAKYERMAQDALYTAEALDTDRRVVQLFFLKGALHQHRWRHAPREFPDAKEVSRLAAIAAYEHFALRLRAAGRTPEKDPMLAQAMQFLKLLREAP